MLDAAYLDAPVVERGLRWDMLKRHGRLAQAYVTGADVVLGAPARHLRPILAAGSPAASSATTIDVDEGPRELVRRVVVSGSYRAQDGKKPPR